MKPSGRRISQWGSILCVICLSIMTALLLGSNYANAATLAFNDANWNWVDHDGLSGTTYTATSNQLTIEASGDDVWTSNDEFAARYLDDVNGDFEISVRIISQENTNSWAKAGIMVKNNMTLQGNAVNDRAHVIMAVTPGSNGYDFQWDTNDNGQGYTNGFANTGRYPEVPFPNAYIKVKRVGNVFT